MPDPLPFDQDACKRLLVEAQKVIADHPEVRSVVICLDYFSPFNTANTQKGIWVGRRGEVTEPDAIVGSLDQVLRMAGDIFSRMGTVTNFLREQLTGAAAAVLARRTADGRERTSGPAPPADQEDTPARDSQGA